MITFKFEVDPCWCEADSELAKALSFVSEHLIRYELKGGMVTLFLEDHERADNSMQNFKRLIEQFHKNANTRDEEVLYEDCGSHTTRFNHSDILNGEIVRNYGDGLIGLHGSALQLLELLDDQFRKFAVELGAIEHQYPVLLPMTAIQKTGYLRNSPQYSMLVSSVREDIDCLSQLARSLKENGTDCLTNPQYALSPAACFHCYMDLENKKLTESQIITMRQHVFRHEGSFNWHQFGRLRDYQVRESVFVGNVEFVMNMRERMIDFTRTYIERLGVTARFVVTHDPFVIPEMQKFKKIQRMEQSKVELQIAVDSERYIACASFNLHGRAFTEPFRIQVDDDEQTVTGCVGFGLERWVLALLSQLGTEQSHWPADLQFNSNL